MHIEVEQNTPEWFEARKGHLNASTAASAAGLKGSYDSRAACWRQYMGVEKKDLNAAMAFGSAHEEDARFSAEVTLGHVSWPVGIFIHDNHDFLASSPDGRFLGVGLHEIKCRDTEPYQSISAQHFCQIQVQLACASYQHCYFQSWTPEEQRIWLVEKNDHYFDWLLPLLEEFWGYILEGAEPPTVRPRRVYPEEINYQLVYEGPLNG